ncbi:metal ABC transporter substrate-binding protein [Aquihabitans sp. McL0605]|uniref:metal ABC transporter substrate-binding protein n=1 Tax=Aquihabitans sp. McL0605 TaxID=3415671 RepID=UPI003CFA0953
MRLTPALPLVIALAALAATVASCSSDSNDDGQLRVVTTVAPITSIVANIAGPAVHVTGIVPEGTNSHTFEPKPSAAKTLATADVVFLNGLDLEDPTEDLAKANVGDGVPIVKLGNDILPEKDWIYDFSFPRSGGKPNPHLWTDPPMAKAYAEVVRDTLAEADPHHARTYQDNYTAFAARIDALDQAMETATATVPSNDRRLLTYHDAYAYFAQHYGWTVVGAIQPSDFADPTAKEVAKLIEQIRQQEVPAIFGSEVFPSPVLAQIADETGAKYVDDLRDDDLPGEPGDAEHSWAGLMRFDYVTMVEALGGDARALKAVDTSDVTTDHADYPQ